MENSKYSFSAPRCSSLGLLLATLLMLNSSMAQPYKSFFGTDTTRWELNYCTPAIGDAWGCCFLLQKMAVGDTVIDGKNYQKVGSRQWGDPKFKFDLTSSDWLGTGLVREDTTSGKAWFLGFTKLDFGKDTLIERLVVDLSLQVGDTFKVFDPDPLFPADSVFIVDSIYYLAGRKHLHFQPAFGFLGWVDLLFVEGMGTSLGWAYMHQGNWCPCANNYFKDTLLVYDNAKCIGLDIEQDLAPLGEIKLYPHPVRDRSELIFDNPKHLSVKLTVFDMWGQIMVEKTTRGTYFEIDRKANAQGLYPFLLSVEGRMVHSGKRLFGSP
jgi:hypothetical protein